MKRTIILLAALAASPALADEAQSDADRWFESRSVLTQQTGEGIYAAVCAGCHMPDGEGAEGAGMFPALADNPNLEFPDYPVSVIVHGLRAMPPLGDILNDAQVAAVTDYIRTSFGNAYEDPTDPAGVAAIR